MVSTEPPYEYTTHNFTAVNHHVEELSRRASVVTSARRAGVFKTYAIYTAVLALGLGIGAWLILLGLAELTDPEPEVIEKEIVVEKPVAFEPNIYITESGADATAVDVKRDEARSVISSMQEEGTASGQKTYDFVIFKEIPFTNDGFKEVVIGMEYESSESKLPSSQWCYIERATGDATSKKASLSEMIGRQRTDHRISASMASELLTSPETLMSAQSRCQFR